MHVDEGIARVKAYGCVEILKSLVVEFKAMIRQSSPLKGIRLVRAKAYGLVKIPDCVILAFEEHVACSP